MDWLTIRKSILYAIDKTLETNSNSLTIASQIPKDNECERNLQRLEDDCVLCESCKCVLETYEDTSLELLDEMKIYPNIIRDPKYDAAVTQKMRERDKFSEQKFYRVENPLLNYAIVSSIIEKVAPREVSFMGIYQCGHSTVAIMKPSSFPVVEDLELEPQKIIKSLTKVLYLLSKHQFSHGRPDAYSLRISNNIFTIDPCEQSCINYKKFRNFQTLLKINSISFEFPEVEKTKITISGKQHIAFYIDELFLMAKRNFGLYCPSVELYFFLCSLRTFTLYREFMEEDFQEFWNNLWADGDAEKVNRELFALEYQDKHSFNDLLPILEKYPLREDATTYLYNVLNESTK